MFCRKLGQLFNGVKDCLCDVIWVDGGATEMSQINCLKCGHHGSNSTKRRVWQVVSRRLHNLCCRMPTKETDVSFEVILQNVLKCHFIFNQKLEYTIWNEYNVRCLLVFYLFLVHEEEDVIFCDVIFACLPHSGLRPPLSAGDPSSWSYTVPCLTQWSARSGDGVSLVSREMMAPPVTTSVVDAEVSSTSDNRIHFL